MTTRAMAAELARRNPKRKPAKPSTLSSPMFNLVRRNWNKSTKADKEELLNLQRLVEEGVSYADLELLGALGVQTLWHAYQEGVKRGRGRNARHVYLEPKDFGRALAALLDTMRRTKDSRRLAEQGSGPGNIAMVLGDPFAIIDHLLTRLEERGHAEAVEDARELIIDVTPGALVDESEDPGRGDRLEVA